MAKPTTVDLRCEDCDIDYKLTYDDALNLEPDVCPFCGADIEDEEEEDEDE
jgi:hypothetical protein